jgi:ABC-type proline/glycine betaine transport system permease subunit
MMMIMMMTVVVVTMTCSALKRLKLYTILLIVRQFIVVCFKVPKIVYDSAYCPPVYCGLF